MTKIVVLFSEPVRGRSRATELPCFHCFTKAFGDIFVGFIYKCVHLRYIYTVYIAYYCLHSMFDFGVGLLIDV